MHVAVEPGCKLGATRASRQHLPKDTEWYFTRALLDSAEDPEHNRQRLGRAVAGVFSHAGIKLTVEVPHDRAIHIPTSICKRHGEMVLLVHVEASAYLSGQRA